MFSRIAGLICTLSILSSTSLVLAVSTSDISADTPISSLLASANAHLAKGETNDALVYYDFAISRDPQNYLTYFKRGATYLSLGRTAQATADFDRVLTIKPGFDGALIQRAKIKARSGDWEDARSDYLAHGNAGEDLAALEEAKGAAILAFTAEKNANWEECISNAGQAIRVASKMPTLRKTRAHCRFEKGDVQEGMSDLKHVLQMQPGTIEPHLQVSAISFYALADAQQGIEQLRKCLHSDPDSKKCKELYRREKMLDKQLTQVRHNLEKKQYATALKTLLLGKDENGLVQDIKSDVKDLRAAGTIPSNAPDALIAQVVEMVCEAYYEQKNHAKAQTFCTEALKITQSSLYGLLSLAHTQMLSSQYESAIATLTSALEQHPHGPHIPQLLQQARLELKRSRVKDYYQVLGVSRDADEVQIKAAYRRQVRLHHPDKAHKQGISKEAAEKKMAAVNEAYEVLSDKELRRRYDLGDDPNDHEQQRQHQQQQHQQYFFQQGGGFPTSFGQGHSGGGQFKFEFGGGRGGGFPGGFNFG